MADYESACRAQLALRALLKGRARLAGIGITGEDGDFFVKVNVVDDGGVEIPERQDGVRVVVERVRVPKPRGLS
ncbi:MAG TPA: hypothetical protein VE891_08895 [Allosphingosinicella sp.]|nr:hypothetical protein [Allosphingosinicella sp.]